MSKGKAAQAATTTASDSLDQFVDATAAILDLRIDSGWKPAVVANLRVILQHAAAVGEMELPDEAEPAPVYKA
jgi:hypothetical protein